MQVTRGSLNVVYTLLDLIGRYSSSNLITSFRFRFYDISSLR